jgi:hypothetical protein
LTQAIAKIRHLGVSGCQCEVIPLPFSPFLIKLAPFARMPPRFTRFLIYPGLIPFAVLDQGSDAEETLHQAAQRIDQIADPATQANLMAASGILAGLKLEQDVIYRLSRRDIM